MSKRENQGFEQIGREISDAIRDALKEIDTVKIKKQIDSWPKPEKKTKNEKVSAYSSFEPVGTPVAPRIPRSPVLKVDREGNPIAPFKGKTTFYQMVGYFGGIPLTFLSVMYTFRIWEYWRLGMSTFPLLMFNLLLLYPATALVLRTGWKGFKLSQARKRFGQYWEELKTRGFAAVQHMAERVSMPTRRVRDEILFMLKEGFFDYGKYDKKTDMLVINEPNYLAHQKAAAIEQQKTEVLEAPKPEAPKVLEEKPEDILAEGRAYIGELSQAREGIQTPQMKADLKRLENTTLSIFKLVTDNPEKLPKIRRFMQYYLPTTVKFAKSYAMMESQDVEGTNIQATRSKIENAMKQINEAFEKLLDELFQKEALDIHSDLIAMETMMARDGLGGKDFVRMKQEEEREEDGE